MNILDKESRKADNLAILALASLMIPIATVIMGHISLSLYKKTGTDYFKPIALLSVIAGWIGIAFSILSMVLVFVGVSSLTELMKQTGINL